MRILVINNKKHKSSYTTCIHTLLEEIGYRHGHQIIHTDNLEEASVANNTIAFITLSHSSLIDKFLQHRKLKSFIVRNKIDLLIQNTGLFVTQKKIPQLLIADDIDQLPAVKQISFSKIFLLTYSQFAKQKITDRGITNTIHVVPFF